jgi:uncharacterized protein YdeI (YjbR/CyaY-like superfamily)
MSSLQPGTVHIIPSDMEKEIKSLNLVSFWEDLTALARNEWICWITSAKKTETRQGRIQRMCENLKAGKRRPCCWAGCPHR